MPKGARVAVDFCGFDSVFGPAAAAAKSDGFPQREREYYCLARTRSDSRFHSETQFHLVDRLNFNVKRKNS